VEGEGLNSSSSRDEWGHVCICVCVLYVVVFLSCVCVCDLFLFSHTDVSMPGGRKGRW